MTIIHSVPGDGMLPHRNNIAATHNRYLLLKRLDKMVAPTYMGGYPTALFFSSRIGSTGLPEDSFGDIDIFPESEDRANEIINALTALGPTTGKTSSWATTFCFDPNITIQVITWERRLGAPEVVLPTFDFVNCAIAYKPADGSIWFHDQAIEAHLNKQLTMLDSWLFNPGDTVEVYAGTTYAERCIAQILRILKYCNRWGFVLDNKTLAKVMEVYHEQPKLETHRNVKYPAGSGGGRIQAGRTENVWLAIRDIIRNSPGWQPSLDTHGLITSGRLKKHVASWGRPVKLRPQWTTLGTSNVTSTSYSSNTASNVDTSTFSIKW